MKITTQQDVISIVNSAIAEIENNVSEYLMDVRTNNTFVVKTSPLRAIPVNWG